MSASIGLSPIGFIRLDSPAAALYNNYNDTKEGLRADNKYLLDHSWLTEQTRDIMIKLAQSFFTTKNKKLEINDCSLIDGEATPEHEGHRRGVEMDIRNRWMNDDEEKAFLQICANHPKVSKVYFRVNLKKLNQMQAQRPFSC
ncbi:hypothetical protein ACWGXJ_25380 [Paenibacillus sp. S33]